MNDKHVSGKPSKCLYTVIRLSKRKSTLTEFLSVHNNNELYLHDHTSTYSIAKAIFRNQNYNTGQLRYFDNNLSRTSKQAEIYFMNCILIKYLEEFISSLIKPFIANWVISGIRVLTL